MSAVTLIQKQKALAVINLIDKVLFVLLVEPSGDYWLYNPMAKLYPTGRTAPAWAES